MAKTTLVNLRHNLAPENGMGHIYMPTSLLTAGSRLIQAGIDVQFQDGNLRPLALDDVDHVGVGVLGAPYIPQVRKQIEGALERPLIVGGQVIAGIVQRGREDFTRLFGDKAIHGNDDEELARALSLSRILPNTYETSLKPAYERLSPDDLRYYLANEFSLFLGQGCAKSCSFCAALHTQKNLLTGKTRKIKEEYRLLGVVEDDLRWLTEKTREGGQKDLRMYLSNLDLFQSPSLLHEFAGVVRSLRQSFPDFHYEFRALSTTEHFLKVHRERPNIIHAMTDAGLHTVGFGVDGDPANEKVKQSIQKRFNTEDNCVDAIRIAREEYGLTPECLMVFGHTKDTVASMRGAVAFAARMVIDYDAVPRPHCSKPFIPGNKGWLDPRYQRQVEHLLSRPDDTDLWEELDFTADPSELTHPRPRHRKATRHYYRMMNAIAGADTKPLFAIGDVRNPRERALRKAVNERQYDH